MAVGKSLLTTLLSARESTRDKTALYNGGSVSQTGVVNWLLPHDHLN